MRAVKTAKPSLCLLSMVLTKWRTDKMSLSAVSVKLCSCHFTVLRVWGADKSGRLKLMSWANLPPPVCVCWTESHGSSLCPCPFGQCRPTSPCSLDLLGRMFWKCSSRDPYPPAKVTQEVAFKFKDCGEAPKVTAERRTKLFLSSWITLN